METAAAEMTLKHAREVLGVSSAATPAEVRQAFPQRSTRIVYRPNPEDPGSDDVDQVIRRILQYGRTCLLLHETVDYASPTRIVPALRRASKVGRSLGGGGWPLLSGLLPRAGLAAEPPFRLYGVGG